MIIIINNIGYITILVFSLMSIQNLRYSGISESRNVLSFETNMSFQNRKLFRDILLNRLSVAAVEKVIILVNNSILTNEQLIHRICLVPIDPKFQLIEKSECDCEKNCNKCSFFVSVCLSSIRHLYSEDLGSIFFPGIKILSSSINFNVSLILKITRKTPTKHYRWSIPVCLEFRCFSKELNSENVEIILSSDLPYDLFDVLKQIIRNF